MCSYVNGLEFGCFVFGLLKCMVIPSREVALTKPDSMSLRAWCRKAHRGGQALP